MIDRLKQVWARLQRTRPLRAWQRYDDLRGNRLAGAVSFYAFVSLFPLLLLSAVAATLVAGPSGVEVVQEIVDENLPGLGIDVSTFYDRAGTLGLIGLATLVFTGLGWVDACRAAVRSMWGLDDQPGNLVARKAVDLLALIGLGVLIVVSWGASVLLGQLAQTVLDELGLEGWLSRAALWLIGSVLSIGASAVLFAYLLTGLPRIKVPVKELALTAIVGAVAFEVLKQFLVSYVAGPASRSAFAAFATPLALLAWIYLVTRLLMYLAALSAESAIEASGATAEDAGEPGAEAQSDGAGSAVVLTPTVRQARAVGVAAGAILGAAGAGLALLAARAARSLRARIGPDQDERRDDA